MKRHIIFCTALLALVFTSCMKSPQIYRLLTKEEQDIVPYQLGQHIRLLDQNHDTIQLAIVRDELILGNENEFFRPNKMQPNISPYCYERIIELTSHADDSCGMSFTVGPDKQLEFRWKYKQQDGAIYFDLLNTPTETQTFNDITYQNVYRKEYYFGNDSIQQIVYYNEEFGLLGIKHGTMSLTRIP